MGGRPCLHGESICCRTQGITDGSVNPKLFSKLRIKREKGKSTSKCGQGGQNQPIHPLYTVS